MPDPPKPGWRRKRLRAMWPVMTAATLVNGARQKNRPHTIDVMARPDFPPVFPPARCAAAGATGRDPGPGTGARGAGAGPGAGARGGGGGGGAAGVPGIVIGVWHIGHAICRPAHD